MNEFEQKLSRQPLRQISAKWRAEILGVCVESRFADPSPEPPRHFTFAGRLADLFWPHPKAWAGLAAIWILIFAINFSIRDRTPAVAEKYAPPSPEVLAELKQQQRLFAELIGANDWREADRQKLFSPKPRSEFAKFLTA